MIMAVVEKVRKVREPVYEVFDNDISKIISEYYKMPYHFRTDYDVACGAYRFDVTAHKLSKKQQAALDTFKEDGHGLGNCYIYEILQDMCSQGLLPVGVYYIRCI